MFTPRDTHMIIYEPYVIYGRKVSSDQKPRPNLHVYSVADGRRISSVIASKVAMWKPQFSDDESVAIRLVGNELLVHKGCQFNHYDRKFIMPHTDVFALSPGHSPLHIACYTPVIGSSPGRVQVRTLDAPFALVTARNFFKSDRAVLQWNSRGSAVLVLCSTDVDTSNQSYYGEQHIYLLNVTSQDALKVELKKTGPIYAAKWNPNGKEFCVCHGFMPAMVSLFNLRGDQTFCTNEGPLNDVFYNAFGNILLTCGFGNLGKGKMEFWDVDKKKQILAIDVPNTTLFEWAPDGQHFFTATTTPRLRIDNCFRMWHYSGKLLNEVLYNSPIEELWEVKFRPMPSYNKFEVRELTKAELDSAGLLIKRKNSVDPDHKQPVGVAKAAAAYVPPHLRKASDPNARSPTAQSGVAVKMSETEKKIFVIKRKLRDIGILKDRLASGEELQANQLEKIAKEPEFLAQLTALQSAP
ncbi:hypothetical protein KIN20_018446 [Parelaphostrongylus tenuis]|nr:hypothetical protein KIN20_018446 [Parelaphostrongylus tenuis]